ncbi:hypothetical protein SEPL_223 [Salmonella phage SE_PL]|nr:hypothetical protein [Salmonella enterica subsp. enterica serovar Infantis]ELL7856584.1 hypothetical protein [Salmonella enterica]QCW18889.1 hypothetical protein 7t3_0368 [Salmonella phage 7t3]QIG62836.1 hypothetical protein SEPL_223 [Salmonella phage SE_PL]WNV47311.1 hypothetical protein [Klebsiella phage fENko-Kae01]
MIDIIVSCAVTAVASFGVHYAYMKYFPQKSILPRISKTNPEPPSGLSTVDYNIEETEEQYLNRLKYIHSTAWQEYSQHADRAIHIDGDRHVNLLILNASKGYISYNVGHHTLNFGSGEEIWIANKYFAYGHIHRSSSKPHLRFSYTDHRLSPYTFLRLVDFEYEHTNPLEWKRKHDEYGRYSHRNRLKARLK